MHSTDIIDEFTSNLNNFNRTQEARDLANSITNDIPKVLGLYTSQIRHIISIIDKFSFLASSDKQLFNSIRTYKSIIEEKERNGITRAVFSNILSSNQLSSALLQKSLKHQGEIQVFQNDFTIFSNEEQKTLRESLVSGPSIKMVDKIINEVITDEDSKDFNYTADFWFNVSTKKIDLLKKLEDDLAHDVSLDSENLAADYNESSNLIIYVSLGLFSLVIIGFVLLGFNISKKIKTTNQKILESVELNNQGRLSERININNLAIDFQSIGNSINLL